MVGSKQCPWFNAEYNISSNRKDSDVVISINANAIDSDDGFAAKTRCHAKLGIGCFFHKEFREHFFSYTKFRYGLNGFRIIDWIVFFSKDGSDLKCTVQKYKQCEEQLARFLK